MLIVDSVNRSFGKVKAVRDVAFSVGQGRILGLLGPNGAGKTTTMRMILGIYAPDSGRISWNDGPIGAGTRRKFGYLPEERGLYGKMTVRGQIAYFGRLHGLSKKNAEERTAAWIDKLAIGAQADRPCAELSKGNQQKVQLGCAVLHEPELLVLDEPFSGLDPVNAETMRDCIEELARKGAAIVLSSHQMFQIEQACDAFCIIGAGTVQAGGTLAELRDAFPERSLRVWPDTEQLRTMLERRGAKHRTTDEREKESIYEVPANTDFKQLLGEAAAAGLVETFERQRPSLEQIYLRAINGAGKAA